MRYLRKIRKESGLSALEVANLIGVAKRTYHCYESGDRDPSFATMEKLEDLFGTSYREILKVI